MSPPEAIDAARAVAASGCIDLRLKEDAPGLYISVDAKGQGGEPCGHRGAHTNITYEAVNGKGREGRLCPRELRRRRDLLHRHQSSEIKKYSIDDMIAFANEVPSEDIAFMQDGIDMNMKIATDAIDRGLNICNTLLKKDSSLAGKAKGLPPAAARTVWPAAPARHEQRRQRQQA